MSATPRRDDSAAVMRQRLRGLKPVQADYLRRAMALIEGGERLLSGQLMYELQQSEGQHPEVQRWSGLRHLKFGEWAAAHPHLARAAEQLPGDVGLRIQLAQAQELSGQTDAALLSLRQALPHATRAAEWFSLSQEFDRQGHYADALAAVERALQLQPAMPVALLQRARCTKALGDAALAAADCRQLIAARQLVARAWFSLVDLKTVRLSDAELALLQRTAESASTTPDDRQLLDFALGKALEDAGRPEAAFAALQRANASARATHRWDAAQFSRHVAAVRAAFEHAVPVLDAQQGREVIFLVGLPRSGTTLAEQVLAAHSQVEGASELPYLDTVIQQESDRRQRPFPAWVADATPADWQRLGRQYLQLSARWRQHKPISTDKLPGNWLLAGAALAMLPGCRIIDCRRDAVETCWSCYKQLFGPGLVGYSYAFDTLAAYWHEYDRLCRFWVARDPTRVRAQQYEALVRDPGAEIRALLAFCDLPFEDGCLEFHRAQRAIRTPSALQVRQPLQQASTPAARYGALLDPLRQLLSAPAG